MRAWPVALFLAVSLPLFSAAETTSTGVPAPIQPADTPLSVTVTSVPVPSPAPEAISFVGVGVLGITGLARRKKLPVQVG